MSYMKRFHVTSIRTPGWVRSSRKVASKKLPTWPGWITAGAREILVPTSRGRPDRHMGVIYNATVVTNAGSWQASHEHLSTSLGVENDDSFGISAEYLKTFLDIRINSKTAWQRLFYDGYLDDSVWDRSPNAHHVCKLLETSRHTGISGSYMDMQSRKRGFGTNTVPKDPDLEQKSWLETLVLAIAFCLSSLRLGLARDFAKVKVLRGGEWMTTHEENIVVGDVQMVSAGDVVTGDCVLLEAHQMSTTETMFSPASVPVTKTVSGDFRVFAGSTVQSGYGVMLVLAVGQSTQQAKLAAVSDDNEVSSTAKHSDDIDEKISSSNDLMLHI